MIQLAVQANNGQAGARRYLDLYETDPIKLTLSIEDITTTDTTAVYSQTFRIPATSNNSAFFVTAFDINGFDFNIAQKQPAEIIVDSDIYQTGEIRLLKVYIDENNNSVDYEILFLGTTRDFASSIGQSPMCDLNLTNLAHNSTIGNIQNSWNAFPEGGLTDGLEDGDVLYPLIDFGNSYDDNLVVDQTRIALGSGIHFTQNSHPLITNRLRPAIRVKAVWDKIFENAGFTYNSEFLDSNLFSHLYVGAFGEEATILQNSQVTAGSSIAQDIPDTGIDKISFNYQSNTGFNLSANEYTVFTPTKYDIASGFQVVSFFDVGPPAVGEVEYRFRLIKESSGGTQTILDFADIEVIGPNDIELPEFVFSSITLQASNITAVVGDAFFIDMQVLNSNSNWTGGEITTGNNRLRVTQEVSGNPGIAFPCDYLQMDFIKDVISKFRLVMAPDRSIPNKFVIEPWQNYIGTGDQLDWTSKLDVSKDLTISPLLYTQKERITFEDKKGEDFLNVLNQTDIGEVYGTLNFDSQQPLLKDERKIKTKLEPVPTTQIDGAAQANNGADNFIIAKIHDQVAEVNPSNNTVVLRNPCKPGMRMFWYDGFKHTGTTPARDVTWYLQDADTGTQNSYTKFPMISEFNEWGDRDDAWQGLDTQTQTLNWQKENTFIRFNLAQQDLGSGCYDVYWNGYTNLLYDPFSRRLTTYLRLDKYDLLNHSFDDAIFLKNGWYYVEKIYSADLTKEQSVKVDLIRLNNFIVSPKDFIPPGDLPQLWENISDNWEVITTNWENV